MFAQSWQDTFIIIIIWLTDEPRKLRRPKIITLKKINLTFQIKKKHFPSQFTKELCGNEQKNPTELRSSSVFEVGYKGLITWFVREEIVCHRLVSNII